MEFQGRNATLMNVGMLGRILRLPLLRKRCTIGEFRAFGEFSNFGKTCKLVVSANVGKTFLVHGPRHLVQRYSVHGVARPRSCMAARV